MKSPKRPWTWAEKSLFLAPLLGLLAVGVWWVRKTSAPEIFLVKSPVGQPPQRLAIAQMAFSPDNKRLAVTYDVKGGKRQVAIYQLSSHSKLCDCQPPAPTPFIYAMEWAADGQQLSADYEDYTKFSLRLGGQGVAAWDTHDGHLAANVQYMPTNPNHGYKFHLANGKKTVADTPLTLRDANTGFPTHAYDSLWHWKALDSKRQQYEDKFKLEIGSELKIRDFKTGSLLWTSPTIESREPGMIGDIQWGPRDVLAAVNSVQRMTLQGHLLLWDGKARKPVPMPGWDEVFDYAFCPNSTLMAVSCIEAGQGYYTGSNAQLVLWDYRSNHVLWNIPFNPSAYNLQWSPDGKWLVIRQTIGNTYHIWLYDAQGKSHLHRSSRQYFATPISSDSRILAIGNNDQIEVIHLDTI